VPSCRRPNKGLPMNRRIFQWLFVFSAACSALWAFYLIVVHHQAVAETLVPGALCGAEGGCHTVLASPEYSEVFGVAVSAPAVPFYLFLAGLGLATLMGRFDPRRLAGLVLLLAVPSVGFSVWLLFHMLVTIGEVCRYCIVMDCFTFLTMGLGLLIHPESPMGAARDFTAHLKRFLRPSPELSLFLVVPLGTLVVHFVGPQPIEKPGDDVPVEVVFAPEVAPETDPKAVKQPSAASLEPKTKRLVLTDKVHDLRYDDTVPFRGPDDAEVTLVLFEDFQCPFCKKLTANVEALMARRDDVRVGFMHFPMHSGCNANEMKRDLHQSACGASAAAVCAQEQGKF